MKTITVFAVLVVAIFFCGCFKIVPTVDSQELHSLKDTLIPIFEEYQSYLVDDPDLDDLSKEIRSESPVSAMRLLDQMIENVEEAEADGYIVEKDEETEPEDEE